MTKAFATVAVLLATLSTASTAFADDKCDTKIAKGISIKGSFAYDRGCMFEAIVVRGKSYKTVESATPKAMAQLGWAKADKDKRQEIAMLWITDVLAAFGEYRVVNSTSDDDSDGFKQKFHRPQTTIKDGAMTITYWSDTTTIGMRMPETRNFVETAVTIDAKGKLTVTDKGTFQEPWK